MPFQVSPGVNVSEIDLTTVVPAVSTTEGAIAGVFRWGPIDKLVLISSEDNLVKRFGKPTSLNPETFFTAASFLSYGNKLYVSRAANTADATGANGVLSAVANTGAYANLTHLVLNEDNYESKSASFESDVHYIARFPGELGNSLKVSVCESAAAYKSTSDLRALTTGGANVNTTDTSISFTQGSATAVVNIANGAGITSSQTNTVAAAVAATLTVGDIIEAGSSTFGKQYLKVKSIGTPGFVLVDAVETGDSSFTITFEETFNLSGNFSSNTLIRNWEFYNNVDKAPGQTDYVTSFGNTAASDAMHVVVVDEDGKVSGVPGTVLEVYQNVSRATDAKTEQGATNYYKDVVNQGSTWVWVASPTTSGPVTTAALIASSTATKPTTLSFVNGSDGDDETELPIGRLSAAYDKFINSSEVDISLILTGKSRGGTNGEQVANYLIDNIAEVRRDCVVFISPDRADVVTNAGKDEADDIVTFRNSLRNTSYAVLDSGYKYMYDKYNDVYRYIPLNGDTAGLCVRTDTVRDPWFSPAGFNRGQIKNVVKLAYNPDKAARDVLYKAGVNPVVTFPGQGTVLYGDKTLLARPSAFDRINVRRLFIVLEKAIATASQFTLFEFNDEFTRAQFKNLVEPFLRDVQGRRGIYDFKVVCDETNNTGEVIDRNEFIGDIYIKPAKSINYIQLNFVAVRTGVEFSEIVGQF
jgi:phage tail sheath protein FI